MTVYERPHSVIHLPNWERAEKNDCSTDQKRLLPETENKNNSRHKKQRRTDIQTIAATAACVILTKISFSQNTSIYSITYSLLHVSVTSNRHQADTVTETCSKLFIIEYIVVFLLNDILVSTATQRDGSYQFFWVIWCAKGGANGILCTSIKWRNKTTKTI
jgi:hypothetical protein